MSNKNFDKGFSLIELLVVVAIIGIISAIAVPRLLSSRRAANEGSAISTMRTIHGVEVSYQSTLGQGDFADLATLVSNRLLDSSFSVGTKSGYNFSATPATSGVRPATYYASGIPSVTEGLSQTGNRRFGICDDGVVRADTTLIPYTSRNDVELSPGLNN